MKRWIGMTGVALAILSGAGCQSRKPVESVAPLPVATAPFVPVHYTAEIQLGAGRYPDLFSPESRALWVAPEVQTVKIAAAREAGDPVEPELMAVAQAIDARFVVIECTTVSAFADMSIAYDVVGFRGVSPFLETGSGVRVQPVQVEIGTPVTEEPRGALKAFTRTNILVFPKEPIASAAAAREPVRLVIEGFHSLFYFTWDPQPAGDHPPAAFSEDERLMMVTTKFKDLYGKLRQFGRKFD